MMRRFIWLVFITAFFLSGCWDEQEISDRNFVIVMGIDKAGEEGDGYEANRDKDYDRFSVSMLSGNLDTENKYSGEIKKSSGETLAEAMHLSSHADNRSVYFGHMKTVVLSKEILKDEALFSEALDTLERTSEINMKTIVLACGCKAEEALTAMEESTKGGGLYIWDFYKNNINEVAFTRKLSLEGLLKDIRQNEASAIPLINVENGNLKIGGAALIAGSTLARELDDVQMRGLIFLMGEAEGAVLKAKLWDAYAGVSILKNKNSYEFYESGQRLYCAAKIELEAVVDGYVLEKGGIIGSETAELSKDLSHTVSDEVSAAFKILQKSEADALGIMEELKKKDYSLFQKYNYENAFKDIIFKSDTDVRFVGKGVTE